MFTEYKKVTEKIIKGLNENNDIDSLMEERGRIIKEIEALNLSKEKVLEEYNRLKLKELDDSLGELIKSKMNEIKADIKESKVRRTAYSSYTSSSREGNFFARKV